MIQEAARAYALGRGSSSVLASAAVSRYTSATDADRAEMLDAIGVDSVDELFAEIPAEAAPGPARSTCPTGCRETEVFDRLAALAARNADAEAEVCFLGAGMYDHYVPAIVDAITQRSEFLTPYTPYQPEVSQGGLQVMFEFQTAISELTGAAGLQRLALRGPVLGRVGRLPGDRRDARAAALVVSRGLHPHSRETLRTYAAGFGAEVVEVGLEGGLTERRRARRRGRRRDRRGLRSEPELPRRGRGRRGARPPPPRSRARCWSSSVDPIALGVLRPPGECGADIALGEGQPLGNRLDFGGPSFGFFCATEEHIRRMPGRIAGETARRRRPPRLRPRAADPRAAHPPREGDPQHLHRPGAERAGRRWSTSPGSASAGIVELGELLVRRTAYARERLAGVDGRRAAARRRRWCASSRCGSTRRSPRCWTGCAEDGIAAGLPAGPRVPRVRGRPARSRSPSGAPRRTSTASPTRSSARSRPRMARSRRIAKETRHEPEGVAS